MWNFAGRDPVRRKDRWVRRRFFCLPEKYSRMLMIQLSCVDLTFRLQVGRQSLDVARVFLCHVCRHIWTIKHLNWKVDNINRHTRLMALCPGLPGWASTRKVKLIWILLKQETVSGSGTSWAICKSAPHSRQITRCPSWHPDWIVHCLMLTNCGVKS